MDVVSNEFHKRLDVEHDIEEVRAIGKVLATEVGLLQARVARLTAELAEERNIVYQGWEASHRGRP